MNSEKSVFLIVFTLVAFLACPGACSDAADLLSDIKVVCLYDKEDDIDWALVYYLVEKNGCRVNLVTLGGGTAYENFLSESEEYDLTSSAFLIPDTGKTWLDSVAGDLYGEYLPDVVFFPEYSDRPEMLAFENYLTGLEYDSTRVFNIVKIFRRVSQGDEQSVYLNSRMYLDNYYDDIAEMTAVISGEPPPADRDNVYSAYELLKSNAVEGVGSPSFLSGIERFKLDRLLEKYVDSSIQKKTLRTYGVNYISFINDALQHTGLARIQSFLNAMTEMKRIKSILEDQIGAVDWPVPLVQYVEQQIRSLKTALLYEAGVGYSGDIFIRETTEGKRLKFKMDVSNGGVVKIRAGWAEFKPFWSDTALVIDSGWVEILPGNSLIREYMIEATPQQLDMAERESMEFTCRILYSGHELDFHGKAATPERDEFSLVIAPDFIIIKPFPELQIDRLVEPTRLNAVLRKPSDYSGNARVEVVTPPSILAGAYEEEIALKAGERALELRIPTVVTKSMGLERHDVIINIIDNGKILASDTARIRQAEYDIPVNRKIALFPGLTGLLEDILIQTGADYRSISERLLLTGELEFYDAVLFGPGAFEKHKSLKSTSARMKKYIEFGGTVIVFGQSKGYGSDLFPVSMDPGEERLSGDDFVVRNSNHTIFSKRFEVDISKLLNRITTSYVSFPAAVFPGEQVIKSENDTAILSVTRFGKGRLIYCGLPLLEMVRDLDIDAIKLFSNLINYTRK